MADSPTSVTPQSNPAISDPAMDTNQIYEHESERPQQVSPDSNIQLAQNDPPHFDNPRNVVVSDSDNTPLMSDTSVAQSEQLGLADKSPAIGGRNRKVEALNYADELAERGQPRDIGNWSNGDADELMNTKSVWKAEDENMRGFERSKLNKVSEKSHDLVQLPSGHVVAVPKNLPEDKKNSIVKGLWSDLTDVSNSVKNAASNAAQALGLPGDIPEWQAKEDAVMRDPIGEAGNAVGALLHGLNTQLAQVAPLSDENKALVQRATDQYKQGNTLAAAVTLVPMVGDNLAKAVVQAKKHDFSGSLGTSLGTALPFLTGAEEEPLPVSTEKPTVPTTTSYAHTPAQNGQFGNLEHAVTTKDLQGNVVGHLAAQDTAPGEVTVRSNQIYDEAHQGQGKGTSQLRTLVNETAKDPAIKTIHSDISTTGAARGAWDKLAMEHPDVVTKENIKGTPRYSVDLDKVRENAANAPEFNGVERRGSARSAPPGATDLEQAMKNPGQRIQTPFDVTEGAMDTINKDINKRLSETPVEPASKPFQEWFGDSKVKDEAGEPLRVYHGTRASADFKEFDTNGRPQTEDGEYTTSGSGADPTSYMGAHFAKEPEVANKFAAGSGWMKSRYEAGVEKPRVIPAYLSLKSPKDFGSEGNLRDFIYQGKLSGYAGEELLNQVMEADGIEDTESPEAEEWTNKYDSDPEFRAEQNRYLFEQHRPQGESDELFHEAAQEIAQDAKSRLTQAGHDGAKYKNEVEGGTSYLAFDPKQIRSALAETRPEVKTVGTAAGAANDTALFQKARQELGPDASLSAVAKRAQELKTAPKNTKAKAASAGPIAKSEQPDRKKIFSGLSSALA